MPLNSNVLCQESSVAAAVGTTLNAVNSTYKIYGLTVSQANFEDIMNQSASDEQNLIDPATFSSTTQPTLGALINFQVADMAYNVIMAMPVYSAVYFASGVGDTRFDPSVLITFMNAQADRYKQRRDRALRTLQNILSSDTGAGMINSDQPGYSSPASPIY